MSKTHHQKAFIQSKVINFLRAAEGGWRKASEIADYIYADTEQGSENTIAVAVMRLRERGFPVATAWGRGYRYAPELWKPLDDQAA